MSKEITRRQFLQAAGLAAAGMALAGCAPKDESIPSPEPWRTEPTAVPPQKETPVPTSGEREIVPTPTWEPKKTEVSFLPEVGGQSMVGELVKANEIQPSEAEGLADNQKRQLNDALSRGREWVRHLVAQGYGDEEGLKLCVAFGQTNAYAARVEKARGYAEGTLFVEGKGDVLTIMPFSKGDGIKALGDKEGSFQGWALFSDKEQLIARVDLVTNRWLVGSGESEEYWLPKSKELGIDLSQVSAPQEKAAIAETVFYSLQATQGANFEWDKVNKGSWQVLAAPENNSAKVLLLNGDKQVFERRWDNEWGREFDIKDRDGNWVGAWLTRQLADVPGGEISFKDGRLQVVDGAKGTYTLNWDRHEWEFIPKSVAEATPQPTPTSIKETPTQAPTKEATPTKEEPKEYVTWSTIEGYSSPNGEKLGTVIPGKHFTILEEQGDWIHVRLEAGREGWILKSETAYGPVGTQPPEGATPEPSKRFPKEIVLADGQLVIHNEGTKWGVVVSDGGFLDASGNYCPGGGLPCEGEKGYDTGMRDRNKAFVEAMFAKYNTSGRILKIFFYDDINKFPFRGQGKEFDVYYRYARETSDNIIELHAGVYKEYNPSIGHQQQWILHEISSNVINFLMGWYDSVINYTLRQGMPPKEIVALEYSSKLTVTG